MKRGRVSLRGEEIEIFFSPFLSKGECLGSPQMRNTVTLSLAATNRNFTRGWINHARGLMWKGTNRGIFAQCNNTVSTPCPFGQSSLIRSSNTHHVSTTVSQEHLFWHFGCYLVDNMVSFHCCHYRVTVWKQLCKSKDKQKFNSCISVKQRRVVVSATLLLVCTVNTARYIFITKQNNQMIEGSALCGANRRVVRGQACRRARVPLWKPAPGVQPRLTCDLNLLDRRSVLARPARHSVYKGINAPTAIPLTTQRRRHAVYS